ncbi:DUF302 domain-containing protein [Oryzomonas japonica]|uniref:DUF302 domain-containing protein n=1 Tax=Oryzomonas japonica TaxID=2603858 RepID=A0A7J4ZMG6_9BACT|nr:DUF302 domain-containing protein [Oryzomonas japonica]KAB0663856.1 DUF302 domain-containing protein [Oryzomonas japonica]
MRLQTSYAFGVSLDGSFDAVEKKVREELAKEGFGVLTEIDVKQTFQKKLGRQFRDYVILGACNPTLAWEAFDSEINIGTLLPCNVVVYQGDDDKTAVMVMDPVAALGMIANDQLTKVAGQVRATMERVLDALCSEQDDV